MRYSTFCLRTRKSANFRARVQDAQSAGDLEPARARIKLHRLLARSRHEALCCILVGHVPITRARNSINMLTGQNLLATTLTRTMN